MRTWISNAAESAGIIAITVGAVGVDWRLGAVVGGIAAIVWGVAVERDS